MQNSIAPHHIHHKIVPKHSYYTLIMNCTKQHNKKKKNKKKSNHPRIGVKKSEYDDTKIDDEERTSKTRTKQRSER